MYQLKWCLERESNPHKLLRRQLSYPLNDRGIKHIINMFLKISINSYMTTQWIVVSLGAYPTYQDLSTVVYNVQFRLSATDTVNDKVYTSTVYDQVNLDLSNLTTEFTPFSALTEEQVVGWLQSTVDVSSYTVRLSSAIQSQAYPKTLGLNPPWKS